PGAGIAIERQIHADLADAAERQEGQLVRLVRRPGSAHEGPAFRLRLWMRTRPQSVRFSSTFSITGVTPSNTGARPPVATTRIGPPPNSALMRWTSPSTSPT